MKDQNKKHDHLTDWFHEGQVSRQIVRNLMSRGFSIDKDNSNSRYAKGEDIIAHDPKGNREIIEVKGYPSHVYAAGPKKGTLKTKTPQKLQAMHWFSGVILSSIYNYAKYRNDPKSILCFAFPLFPIYVEQLNKVSNFFNDHNINFKVYFVNEQGNVTVHNFRNANE